MRYRMHLICPTCNRLSQHVQDGKANPRINCGDCLIERVSVVELKVVAYEPEELVKPWTKHGGTR